MAGKTNETKLIIHAMIKDSYFGEVVEEEWFPLEQKGYAQKEFRSRLKSWGGIDCGYKLSIRTEIAS